MEKPKGELTIQTVAMPADTNANGDIFGGWLVSYMDLGAGIAARNRAHSRAVTVGIDGLRFLKPVNVGDVVCCYADLFEVGRTSMKINMTVWTLSHYEKEQKKAAEGRFIFVAIDEQGRPQPVDR